MRNLCSYAIKVAIINDYLSKLSLGNEKCGRVNVLETILSEDDFVALFEKINSDKTFLHEKTWRKLKNISTISSNGIEITDNLNGIIQQKIIIEEEKEKKDREYQPLTKNGIIKQNYLLSELEWKFEHSIRNSLPFDLVELRDDKLIPTEIKLFKDKDNFTARIIRNSDDSIYSILRQEDKQLFSDFFKGLLMLKKTSGIDKFRIVHFHLSREIKTKSIGDFFLKLYEKLNDQNIKNIFLIVVNDEEYIPKSLWGAVCIKKISKADSAQAEYVIETRFSENCPTQGKYKKYINKCSYDNCIHTLSDLKVNVKIELNTIPFMTTYRNRPICSYVHTEELLLERLNKECS